MNPFDPNFDLDAALAAIAAADGAADVALLAGGALNAPLFGPGSVFGPTPAGQTTDANAAEPPTGELPNNCTLGEDSLNNPFPLNPVIDQILASALQRGQMQGLQGVGVQAFEFLKGYLAVSRYPLLAGSA